MMGSLKTVPPKAFRIVPLGDSHTIHCQFWMRRQFSRAPTLLKVEFLYASLIRSDSCAFHTHRVLLNSFGRVNSDLIICLVSVLEAEIIILEIDVQIRMDKFVLDVLPYDSGHLVTVQLYHRVLHFDLLEAGHLARLREYCAEAGRVRCEVR